MSSESEEKDGQVIQESTPKLPEPPLNLFKPRGVTNHVLLQCVFYIAPNNEKKKWSSSERIDIYCTKCKFTIYNSSRSTKAHEHHMKNFH